MVTASVSFACGWALTIVNFFAEPLGETSDSTLWILSQALLYCGAVVGITNYVNRSIHGIRHELGLKDNADGVD